MIKKSIIVGFIFCFGALSVSGQAPLSLLNAVEMGLANNYDIQIESKNIEVATNNNTWGEAGRLPSLTFDLDQNNTITNNIKTVSPFQLQGKSINNSVTPAITLNWTIFNGFKANINKSRLATLQQETAGNASIVIANNLQSIILGYYLVVLERDRLTLLQQSLDLSRDKYQYIKVKKDLGSVVTTDLLIEENNYLADSISFINQELVVKNALRNLNVLLGEKDIDRNYQFTDSLTVEITNYDYESLHNKMTANNVDLKKQYLTQQLLAVDKKLRYADRYPNIGFRTGYSYTRSRVDLSNAGFPSEDGSIRPGPEQSLSAVNDNIFANFTLSFNLFNGGKINRAIQNAVITEDIGNVRIEKLKNSLDRDLSDALDQYNVRAKLLGINEQQERSAQLNLTISEDRFKAGSINSFDFRTVQNNFISAGFARLQSVYNMIDAQVSLMRLTGGLVETYQQEK